MIHGISRKKNCGEIQTKLNELDWVKHHFSQNSKFGFIWISARFFLETTLKWYWSHLSEIKRKTSVGKRSLPKTTGQELHDLFYAPSRPSPKSLEFYQNRPRSAVSVMNSSHERTNSNSSQTSNQSNSKKIFASLEDCKRTVITMGANGKVMY